MKKKFLILGGAGFIGSHLCDALLLAGHSVRLFDRVGVQPHRVFGAKEEVEHIQGDFGSEAEMQHAVSGCQVVFHLVSTTLPKSSNDDPVYDVESNVVGTLRLLEATRLANVQKIVFVSSGGTVYGIPKAVPISESHATEPVSSYGIGKLMIEKYLHLHQVLYSLDYSVLRLANPFGERQRANSAQGAVAVFLNRAINNTPIDIWGDGSVVRDYVYISDVTAALLKAAEYHGKERIFNIGSGQGKSLNEILSAIESLLLKPVARQYLAGRSFDVPINVLDVSHARKHLLWAPVVSFESGLANTLRSLPHSFV
jgi:UDP-glucose 4-epimerase